MKRLLVICCAALLVFACVNNYSRSDWEQEMLESALSGVLDLTVEFEAAYGKDDDYWFEVKKRGVAISMGNGYVLGLTHCFDTNSVIISGPFGSFKREIYPRNVKAHIGDQALDIIGSVDDIMLFKSATGFEEAYPFKWADSDNLKIGDRVIVAGFPYMGNRNLRDGILSDTQPKNYPVGEDIKYHFLISTDCIGGDSGSPVLVMRWGKAKVAGLVQMVDSRGDNTVNGRRNIDR